MALSLEERALFEQRAIRKAAIHEISRELRRLWQQEQADKLPEHLARRLAQLDHED